MGLTGHLHLLVIFAITQGSDGSSCTVSFPISSMPDDCTSVSGDLNIDGSDTTSMLSNHFQHSILVQKLSKVETWQGSIRIAQTDFEDLSFLKSLRTIENSWTTKFISVFNDEEINFSTLWIEYNSNLTSLAMPNLTSVVAIALPTNQAVYSLVISQNNNLCMTEQEYWKLRVFDRSYLREMKFCDETNLSKKFCYKSSFLAYDMPLGCQVLMSGIWLRDIRNTSIQSHLNDAFSTVEEVHGPIVIFRTDFTNLSFPLLHTIRNQYYDGQDSWQWQVLIIRGNYFLESISFPKLVNFHHFGNQPQLTNSANYIWQYTKENCDLFRKIPFFSILDTKSNCGLIPIINDGQWSTWVIVQVAEKIAAFSVNFVICAFLGYKIFKSKVGVNFFHFALITFILLNMSECLYVNLDFMHIFNDHGFAIPVGVRSLFITHDATLFNQISNVMYVNRLALLISCTFYRSLYILSDEYEKYGLLVSCIVFILSNVWNLSVMENLQNKYTYVLFQLNWITLVVTVVTGIFVRYVFDSKFSALGEMGSSHNQLSVSLFLQALWTFIFCGYSDGLNQYFVKNNMYVSVSRWWDSFFYYYGGLLIRWHYAMLMLIILAYLPSTFVKFPHKTKITSVASSTKS